MGTRADFYVGRGESAEWLGSIAWDGMEVDYITTSEVKPMWEGGPMTNVTKDLPKGERLTESADEETYRQRVAAFFWNRDDVSLPEHGWPWPWETSHTTDYAYAFDGNQVWVSCFGDPWHEPEFENWDEETEEEIEPEGDRPVFPNMKEKQNVNLDLKKSGIMIVGPDGIENDG